MRSNGRGRLTYSLGVPCQRVDQFGRGIRNVRFKPVHSTTTSCMSRCRPYGMNDNAAAEGISRTMRPCTHQHPPFVYRAAVALAGCTSTSAAESSLTVAARAPASESYWNPPNADLHMLHSDMSSSSGRSGPKRKKRYARKLEAFCSRSGSGTLWRSRQIAPARVAP